MQHDLDDIGGARELALHRRSLQHLCYDVWRILFTDSCRRLHRNNVLRGTDYAGNRKDAYTQSGGLHPVFPALYDAVYRKGITRI